MSYNATLGDSKNIYLKYTLLCLALSTWMLIPILGIFPILLFIHFNSRRESFVQKTINTVLLLLVIITVSIFGTLISYQVDTVVYLNAYRDCGAYTISFCLENAKFEPLFYLIAYPIFKISGGSEIVFLILWSFLINCLMVFLVCNFILSKKYKYICIILILLSPAFYVQNVLMRQYMANTLLLSAIALKDNRFLFYFLILLAILSHSAILLLVPLLFIDYSVVLRVFKNSKNIKRVSIILSALLLTISIFGKIDYSSLGNINSLFASTVIESKTNYNLDTQLESIDFKGILFLLIPIGLFYCLISSKKSSCEILQVNSNDQKLQNQKLQTLILIYVVLLSLFLLTINLGFLPYRLSLMLLSYTGLFFSPFFEKDSNLGTKSKQILIVLIGILYFSYFIYFLYNVSNGNNPNNYVDGKPFTKSIFDYIQMLISIS
jgi:hypothetical protein